MMTLRLGEQGDARGQPERRGERREAEFAR